MVSLPHHCVWFHQSGAPGEFFHTLRFNTSPVPHLRLSVVDTDVGMSLQFLGDDVHHISHSIRVTNDHQIIEESKQLLVVPQTTFDRLQRCMLSQREQHNMGMRGSPCSPPLLPSLPLWDFLGDSHLVFPQICGWGPKKTPHEREDLISVFHLQDTLHHCISGDQIVRPHPIHGHHCGIGITISNSLQNVNNALTPGLRGKGVGAVAFSAFLATCLAIVLATRRRIMSPTTIPLTPPSGLFNVVNLPNRMPSITSSGTSPQANLETTSTESGSLSKTGN